MIIEICTYICIYVCVSACVCECRSVCLSVSQVDLMCLKACPGVSVVWRRHGSLGPDMHAHRTGIGLEGITREGGTECTVSTQRVWSATVGPLCFESIADQYLHANSNLYPYYLLCKEISCNYISYLGYLQDVCFKVGSRIVQLNIFTDLGVH